MAFGFRLTDRLVYFFELSGLLDNNARPTDLGCENTDSVFETPANNTYCDIFCWLFDKCILCVPTKQKAEILCAP
jgi:hypothetical protein